MRPATHHPRGLTHVRREASVIVDEVENLLGTRGDEARVVNMAAGHTPSVCRRQQGWCQMKPIAWHADSSSPGSGSVGLFS